MLSRVKLSWINYFKFIVDVFVSTVSLASLLYTFFNPFKKNPFFEKPLFVISVALKDVKFDIQQHDTSGFRTLSTVESCKETPWRLR